MKNLIAFFILQLLMFGINSSTTKPLVINTWNFLSAGQKGKYILL